MSPIIESKKFYHDFNRDAVVSFINTCVTLNDHSNISRYSYSMVTDKNSHSNS